MVERRGWRRGWSTKTISVRKKKIIFHLSAALT